MTASLVRPIMLSVDIGSGAILKSDQSEAVVIPADRKTLNSWKEIARYLVRGVRTVQRWERDLHLPVHRPSGQHRSAVLAFSDEIDGWLAATPLTKAAAPEIKRGLPPRTRELLASVRSRTVTLVHAAEKLQTNLLRAQEQHRRWKRKTQQLA